MSGERFFSAATRIMLASSSSSASVARRLARISTDSADSAYSHVIHIHTYIHTYMHTFNGPLSGTTWVSRYQKSKTNLDFTEARDSEWLWHQLGHMHVCTSLKADNHASTPPLSFLQVGCPSCRPTNSI